MKDFLLFNRGKYPGNALQIWQELDVGPNSRIEHFAYLSRLVESHFEKQHTACFEITRRAIDEVADDVKPLSSRRECNCRFVIAHLWLKSLKIHLRNVRRIREYSVELLF